MGGISRPVDVYLGLKMGVSLYCGVPQPERVAA
jgi:hypothetical protein